MTKLAAEQEGERLDHQILVYILCGRKRETKLGGGYCQGPTVPVPFPLRPASPHPGLAVMHCFMHRGGSGGALQPPLRPNSCPPRYLRSLMPKQLAHSSRAMYLSLSRSQASKKRVVQCSMGIRGARSGASSVCDRYLPGRPHAHRREDAGPSSLVWLLSLCLPSVSH